MKREDFFMPLRKSEFLRNLSTATTRFISNISPTDNSGSLTTNPRVASAKGHATDLGIFIEDEKHLRDDDNPVLRAIVWFGTREVSRSSPVEDMEMAEEAWEYFSAKRREEEHKKAIAPKV